MTAPTAHAAREALLIVSFGGPEQPADVRQFLENVTRGRGVPPERLDEVESHYRFFGGRSPINDQVRALIAALRAELARQRRELPIYWGNRNWHPFLAEAVAQLRDDGIELAHAFVTSAYSSYSACRQYLEDIEAARAAVPGAPPVHKLRPYFDHPGFIEPMADRARTALAELADPGPGGGAAGGDDADLRVLFCAHSIPRSMAAGCAYEAQLRAAAALVADRLAPEGGAAPPWELVWQSRSGPPRVPWLEPDVGDRIVALAGEGVRRVLLVPIGFVSDHLEVVYDLDTVAVPLAGAHGVRAVRAATVGTDARFVQLVIDLVDERRTAMPAGQRPALSTLGVWPDVCAADCCPPPARPAPGGGRGAGGGRVSG